MRWGLSSCNVCNVKWRFQFFVEKTPNYVLHKKEISGMVIIGHFMEITLIRD